MVEGSVTLTRRALNVLCLLIVLAVATLAIGPAGIVQQAQARWKPEFANAPQAAWYAQPSPTAALAIPQAPQQNVQAPDRSHEFAFDWANFLADEGASIDPVLTKVIMWLSANFALPATLDHPRIEYVPAEEMAAIRYKGLHSARRPDAAALRDQLTPPEQVRQTVALYNDQTKTIYLANGWRGNTPAELSILVHEVVHHLQNVARLQYECLQAREKLAYEAQEKWLAQYGKNLKNEFGLDPMSILIKSLCN